MTIELVDGRVRSSWLARLLAAIVSFLVKMAFFGVMTALGLNGLYWLPPAPHFPVLSLVNLVTVAVAYCSIFMFLGGLIGLAVTVFTAGRKPRWD